MMGCGRLLSSCPRPKAKRSGFVVVYRKRSRPRQRRSQVSCRFHVKQHATVLLMSDEKRQSKPAVSFVSHDKPALKRNESTKWRFGVLFNVSRSLARARWKSWKRIVPDLAEESIFEDVLDKPKRQRSSPRRHAERVARYTGPDAIWAALMSGNVRLVKMSWLIKRSDSAKRSASMRLPRRQEMPEEAYMTVEELKELYGDGNIDRVLPIIAISYCWLTVSEAKIQLIMNTPFRHVCRASRCYSRRPTLS